MKIGILLLLILLGLLVFTNPSLEDHKAEVKRAYIVLIDKEVDDSDLGNGLSKISKGLGGILANNILDSRVFRQNYVAFSLTAFQRKDQTDIVGIGLLGNVFLFGEPSFNNEQLKSLDINF